MREVLGFLVWLFSFWTWKAFFLRWLGSAASHPGSGEPAGPSFSQEGQQESKLARFLSSLPGDGRACHYVCFQGCREVLIRFGEFSLTLVCGPGVDASYGEFLEAVASSEIVFSEEVVIVILKPNYCYDVEAFGDALRKSCNRFQHLWLGCFGGSAIQFANIVSSLLLGNDAIPDIGLSFNNLEEHMGKELVARFMGIIGVPRVLRILKSFDMGVWNLHGEGMEQLLKPFQDPVSVLRHLILEGITSDTQLEHVGGMLAASTSLKSLRMSIELPRSKKFITRGFKSMAAALCSNQSLQYLGCCIPSGKDLKVLLAPLIPRNNNLQGNSTLSKLLLYDSIGGQEGIASLVDMLCTNTSLLELRLLRMRELSLLDIEGVENVLAILGALKVNKFLKKVDFFGNTAVGGSKVLGAMMDLLLENYNIQDIDLDGTGLSESGDADYVTSALSKRKKMELWSVVQSMAIDTPTSGRVFLCGQPFAGKTRLRMSMKQLKEFCGQDEIPSQSRIKEKLWKKFKMPHAPNVPLEGKPLERTHGIEVESVRCDGISITIWDMAGQTDYHCFHELVMPNLSADGSASMFLLMCNPMEQLNLSNRRCPSAIKLELEFWLRFIASNTRRSLLYRPHVSIVMTHFDYWIYDDAFADCIDDVVEELQLQFEEILEFDKDQLVFKVNGWNVPHAHEVFDFMKSHMKQLLGRLPKTIKACEDVRRLVALWNVDKSRPALLKWEVFCEGLCKEVEELNGVDHELVERKREFVAISLNDGGHIIYDEKGRVVITDPHWFCHQIVGQFLHQCTIDDCNLEMVSANGIISMEHMKRLLLRLVKGQGDMEKQFEEILGMMMKLHICYEQDVDSIMIPSTLKDKHPSLRWSMSDNSTSFKYVGRRLACKDGTQTMLTLGFFIRLQVSFFEKLRSKNDQDTYQVFQDIIRFISDQGIEVILQYHDGDMDILLRSHQCEDEMLEFLEYRIVLHIKHLQEDPTLGCPGVHLIEYILRPACVQRLVHAKHRKNQCVQVEDLEAKVIEMGVDARYMWKSCEDLDIGYDKVSTLLGSKAWKDLLERRSHELHYYHKKMQSLGTRILNDDSTSNHERSGSWTSSIWLIPQKLLYGPFFERLDDFQRVNIKCHQVTWSKMDTIGLMIQNLEHNIHNMQRELLLEVCSKINDVMAFSLQMQKSQVPRLAYLCLFGKRKLLTQFVPGLAGIQLHLMCENMHGFHEVPNQEGCMVYFGTEHTRRFLTMVAWGLKIATLLTKIGAHVACGTSSLVPDFSDGVTFAASILDTPSLLDYKIPIATLESLPSDVKKDSRISLEDQCDAQKWLQEFLEPKCRNKGDFYKQFGLKKVCYTKARGSIAWICDKCITKHSNDIVELN